MTLHECTELLAPLALAMRVDLDEATIRAYAGFLKPVPVDLAALGLQQLSLTGLTFFPTAPEIQCAAERARRSLVALNPWRPCEQCEDSPRFRKTFVGQVERLERCPCVAAHQTRLAERGLLEPIAVLPAEAVSQELVPIDHKFRRAGEVTP